MLIYRNAVKNKRKAPEDAIIFPGSRLPGVRFVTMVARRMAFVGPYKGFSNLKNMWLSGAYLHGDTGKHAFGSLLTGQEGKEDLA